MAGRTVMCSKLKVDAQGLDIPPFAGELGQEVFEKVSAAAWLEWRDQVQIKIINEYRLNLGDPDHFQILIDQLRAYLNLDDKTEILEVENENRGRGER